VTIGCDHPRPPLNLPGYVPPRFPWQPPATVPTDPQGMARAMLEGFRGIYAILQQLGQKRAVVPLIENIDARAGQVIVGVADGQTITLPPAVEGEIGLVSVVLTDVANPVTVVNPDGTEQTVAAAGAYDFVSGLPENYQTNPGGSVVTSMAGLSVLGRSGSTSGPAAAITSTAARQSLMSNSAGTAIGWRTAEYADLETASGLAILAKATNNSTPSVMSPLLIGSLGGKDGFAPQLNEAAGTITWARPAVLGYNNFGLEGAWSAIDFQDATPGVVWTITHGSGIIANRTLTVVGNIDGYARTNEPFLTYSSSGTLSAERVLSNGTNTVVDLGTVGQAQIDVDDYPLSGLADQAAETFVGNFTAGTAPPTARAGSSVAGDGLQYAAGGTLNIDVSDFAGTGLEDDGSENLRIAASAAGAGLTGGGGSALAVGAGTNVTVTADAVSVDDYPLTGLADQAANTIVANATGSSAAPTAVAVSADSVLARVGGDLTSHAWGTLAGIRLAYSAGVIDWTGIPLFDTGVFVADAYDALDFRADSPLDVAVTDFGGGAVRVTYSLSDGDRGDITVSSSGTVWTIDNSAVTLAKLANQADDTFLANISGGAAPPSAVSLTTIAGDGLTYDATNHELDVAIRLYDSGVEVGSGFHSISFGDTTSVAAAVLDAGSGIASVGFTRAALTGAVTASANSNATLFDTNASGAGLTGGGTAVLAVGAGTRITVNANDVQLAAGAAESFLGNFTAGSAVADYRAGSSVAGAGLTYTAGGTLAVGAGTGITVNADDVQLATLAAETFFGNFTAVTAVGTARAGSSVAGAGLTYTAGGTLAVGAGTYVTVNADDVTINRTTLAADLDSTSIIANTGTLERAALTGDVTASQNSNATTIANDAVTNAKLANMADGTIKGRALGAGSGDPTDLTGSQVGQIVRTDVAQSISIAAGSTHDLTVNAGVSIVYVTVTGAGTATVRSIAWGGGGSAQAGVTLRVWKTAGNTLAFSHDAVAGDNRLFMPNAATWTLSNQDEGIVFQRNAATSGDVWRVIGSQYVQTAMVADNAVTNAKAADMAQSRIKGRAEGAGTGDPTDLTPTQTIAIIDGENATWTGVHSFTGSSHTVNVTGAANIDADADSHIATSVDSLTLETTAAAGLLNLVARGGAATSGSDVHLGNSVTVNASNLFRISTGNPVVERLEVETDGAWQVNGNTGTTGQVLTSQGNAASPEWQIAPRCTEVYFGQDDNGAGVTPSPPADATWWKARFKGSGGGGGGADADNAVLETCAGGGGGEGAEIEVWYPIVSGSFTVVIGDGGNGGSNTGGNGTNGASTSVSYNGETYTAGGGSGGTGQSAGVTGADQSTAVRGGAGGSMTASGSGHIMLMPKDGQGGDPGISHAGANAAGSHAAGGTGGGGARGGVVAGAAGSQAGEAAGVNGGGGGGGGARIATATPSTGVIGGKGGDGYCIIEFYSGPVPTSSGL
jgi:hypothetical protein